MYVGGLWRYPVKSLGAEPLAEAELTGDGVRGDRLVHVRGPRGPLTGRTRHGLLTVPASTGADGNPRVAGHRWDSPEAAEIIEARAGAGSELVAFEGPERFDVLNLLVATDGAVDRLGHGAGRLRPNILIGGVPAEAEASWPGQALAIGDALMGVYTQRLRCIVTSIDPDTGEQDLEVFRRIRHSFGGNLALNCWVIKPGTIRLGQGAELVSTDQLPGHVGGWIVGAPYSMTG
jgi:uncharacterized protein